MRLRLVVADDNYLVREGVRRLLDEGDDVETVGTAASAPELLLRVRELQPDVVLTDIRMPPSFTTDGIAAAVRVRAEHSGVGVVVLSQHADASYAAALFAAGTGGHRRAGLPAQGPGRRPRRAGARATGRARGRVGGRPPGRRRPPGGRAAFRTVSLRNLSPREIDVLRGMAEGARTAPSRRTCTSRNRP
ncbi:response regulator [Blastococcus brunescens]|uniref:response regulator n=1 Tax=Blastococcus brunescens TaxID=1564165 RepID=UPI003BEF080B